ncbi:MAG: hypothetical protein ACO27U_06380 [Ilumatobacteraceae bacterium]|jgi:hypothetical protein
MLPRLFNPDMLLQRAKVGAMRGLFSAKPRTGRSRTKVSGPIRAWRGSWKLVAHTGYREWLTARGMSPDDVDDEVTHLFHRSVTTIGLKDEAVTVSQIIRWKGRKRTERRLDTIVVDGQTVFAGESPTGPVTKTAIFAGEDLVVNATGSRGPEVHRYTIQSNRLHVVMTGVEHEEALLEFERI